jgi:uncharacterized protein YfdQ (DUF2303 family)
MTDQDPNTQADEAIGVLLRTAENENGALLTAGMALSKPKKLDPAVLSYVLVPEGAKVQEFDRRNDPPVRIHSSAVFYDAGSFCRYVKTYQDLGSHIFGDELKGAFLAILDYHAGSTTPRWGHHHALLQLRPTEAWKRWLPSTGKRMDQVTFATFLEDGLPDIAEPAGAVLLEIAKEFEVRRNVSFSSGVRLNNGQHQLEYQEQLAETAKKGTVTVPETFVLGLAPWVGVELYRLQARLRYRLQDGKLSLWYDLVRPEEIVRAAFGDVRQFLKAQTGIDPYLGTVDMKEGAR